MDEELTKILDYAAVHSCMHRKRNKDGTFRKCEKCATCLARIRRFGRNFGVPEQERARELERTLMGLTREKVIEAIGEPKDKGVTSRKYKTPAIFKYKDFELHFEPWKEGTVVRVSYVGSAT